MKVSTILKKALALISKPGKFCKGYYALNEDGHSVIPNSKSAKRFCAIGSVVRVSTLDPLNSSPGIRALQLLVSQAGTDQIDLSSMNDGPNGRRRVIAAYKKAIKEAEKQEAAE